MSSNPRQLAQEAFFALSTALSNVPCRDRKQHDAMADIQEAVETLTARLREEFPAPQNYPDR